MTMSVWRAAKIAMCGTLIASVLACASGTHAEPEIDAFPVVTSPSELVLPLDSYDYTDEGYVAFFRAEGELVRQCMRRFGVEVPAEDWETSSLPTFSGVNYRRYGLFDLEAASIRGYQVLSSVGDVPEFVSAEELEEHRRETYAWIPSEAEYLLLMGETSDGLTTFTSPTDVNGDPLPEGGCSGEATGLLADGLPEPQRPLDAGVESFERAESDSRVQAVMASWSDCMSELGHEYRSVWEPNERDWPNPVTEEEIITAVADVECKLATNLVGIWYAVESAHQIEFIEENAERLEELKIWLDTVQRNSAQLLADG